MICNFKDNEKIIYYFYSLIPFGALFLGKFIDEKIFFIILKNIIYFLITALFIRALFDSKLVFTENLIVFSIYQLYQYVLPLFVYLLICIHIIFDNKKNFILTLFFLLCICLYSKSFSAIFLLICFLIFKFFKNGNDKIITFGLFVFMFFLFFALFQINSQNKKTYITQNKINLYGNHQKFYSLKNFTIPKNISIRFEIWNEYYNEIKNNKKILIFGYDNKNLKKKYNSAHNLFLDNIYMFGIFSLTPYLILIFFLTKKILFFLKNQNNRSLYILLFSIIYLAIENLAKVSLKQPYPGILTMLIISIVYFKDGFISYSKSSH